MSVKIYKKKKISLYKIMFYIFSYNKPQVLFGEMYYTSYEKCIGMTQILYFLFHTTQYFLAQKRVFYRKTLALAWAYTKLVIRLGSWLLFCRGKRAASDMKVVLD